MLVMRNGQWSVTLRTRVIATGFLLFCLAVFPVSAAVDSGDVVSGAFRISGDATQRIVVPTEATVTEQFAAEELSRYLEKMTGASVPIFREGDDAGEFVYFVGRTSPAQTHMSAFSNAIVDIEKESFVCDVTPERVVLVGGGDRGTLYAVYDFLQTQGCRWFQPGAVGEYVPQLDALSLESGVNFWKPVFAVREIGFSGPETEKQCEELIDWVVKSRLNRLFALRPYCGSKYLSPAKLLAAWQKRGGCVEWQHICHNYPSIAPNEKYFDAHPEYYSLYKGRRLQVGKEGGNLCTTHPAVQELAVSFVTNWFATHPEGVVVPLCPSDGAVKWCECEACRALGGENFVSGPEGSMTRRQVDFINRVAAEIAQDYPSRYILNLAYSRYVMPYHGVTMESNVVVQVAHGYAGNGHMTKPITAACNDEARKIFEEWSASGADGIGIWDYFILQIPGYNGSAMTPLGFGNVVESMVRFLAALPNPYRVYFTQAGNALQESNVFLYYALTQLLQNPDLDFEQLRADYAQQVFGSARQPVVDYLKALDEAFDNADWFPETWHQNTVPSPKVFTPEFLDRARGLLEQAAELIPTDNTRAAGALARMRQSLDYAAQSVAPRQLVASDDGIWKFERGQDAYIVNAGSTNDNSEMVSYLRDQAVKNGLLDDSMRRILFRCLTREEPIVWLENDRIKVGVLPGIGGRIIRLIDKANGKNAFHEPMEISELEDPGERYLQYGGYEEYMGKAFAGPGWELPMDYQLVATNGSNCLTMSVEHDGLHLERRLTVPDGEEPVLSINSQITNISGESHERFMLRVHPELKTGKMLEDLTLVVRDEAGNFVSAPLEDAASMEEYQVDGSWGVVNFSDQSGILNEFSTNEASSFLHLARPTQSFNMELFGVEEELFVPGESVSINHSYRLLNGQEELVAALGATCVQDGVSDAGVFEDQTGNITLEAGQVGQGMRIGATGTLRYSRIPALCYPAGTMACWVKLDQSPSACQNDILMSFGTRQPDYSVVAIRSGSLVLYRTKGGKPYAAVNEAWLKLVAPIDWAPGSWHHVAAMWSANGDEGSVQLFVDGELRAERSDVRILPVTGSPELGLAWDTSSFRGARLAGVLDQVRVFDSVLSPDDVQALMQDDECELSVAPLLLLNFDNPTANLAH